MDNTGIKGNIVGDFFFFSTFLILFLTSVSGPSHRTVFFLKQSDLQRRKVTYIKTLCSWGKACFSFVSIIDNVKNIKKQDTSIINVKHGVWTPGACIFSSNMNNILGFLPSMAPPSLLCLFFFFDSIISQFIDQTTVFYQYYARGYSHYVISDFLCLLVPKILWRKCIF